MFFADEAEKIDSAVPYSEGSPVTAAGAIQMQGRKPAACNVEDLQFALAVDDDAVAVLVCKSGIAAAGAQFDKESVGDGVTARMRECISGLVQHVNVFPNGIVYQMAVAYRACWIKCNSVFAVGGVKIEGEDLGGAVERGYGIINVIHWDAEGGSLVVEMCYLAEAFAMVEQGIGHILIFAIGDGDGNGRQIVLGRCG